MRKLLVHLNVYGVYMWVFIKVSYIVHAPLIVVANAQRRAVVGQVGGAVTGLVDADSVHVHGRQIVLRVLLAPGLLRARAPVVVRRAVAQVVRVETRPGSCDAWWWRKGWLRWFTVLCKCMKKINENVLAGGRNLHNVLLR